MNLTKKDIITINQEFAQGHFENESSLDFALNQTKRNISWTKQLAYLMRAILVDHVFHDGNKRSACAVLLTYVELNNCKIEEKQAINIIKNLVLKNEKSITNMQRRIEDAITKK